jgi:hypothetical protein
MTAPLADPELPAVATLLGDGVAELAARWLGARGGALRDLRRERVLYRPGRSIAVVFAAAVAWDGPGGEADERLVAAAGPGSEGPDMWLYPIDPGLPALARLADDGFVEVLAARAGLPDAPLELSDRAYRPLRRATVELAAVEERLVFSRRPARVAPVTARTAAYLKALRPGHVEPVRRRLALLGRSLPVPACLVADEDLGMLVVEERPGRTLQRALRDGDGPPPAPERLIELLDAVARTGAPLLGGGARPRTTAERIQGPVRLLKAVLPEQAARLERLAQAFGDDAAEPVVATHDDFHPSQLLVDDDGEVVGLLDVDGAGPGRRVDDLASMLGRVWTSGAEGGRGSERFAAYAERLYWSFAAVAGPRELSRQTAAVVLGRATGPFRAQQHDWRARSLRRLELAERWLGAVRTGTPPARAPA